MDMRDLSVATITLARDEGEDRLLREALGRLSLEPMRVAVSDGGSRPELVEFLQELKSFAIARPAGRGLVAQVKASLRTATAWRSPFVLYTEPDKRFFFERRLTDFIAGAPADADVGVVLAARDAASFATFPAFQRLTEGAFNAVCADIVGEPGDYCYGPFLLNRALLPQAERVDPEIGWGWRPFMFATARRLGYRVVHRVGDFPCPPGQRAETDADRIHRLRQLSQNIEGLIYACTTC